MTLFKKEISPLKAKNTAFNIIVPIIRWIFLIAVGYIIIYPLLYMIAASLRPIAEFDDPTVVWISKTFTFDNFEIAWKSLRYPLGFWNTIKTEIFAGLIEVVSCSVIAYGLARFEFKEKNFLMFFLILTILIPTQMLMIPIMLNMKYFDCLGILKFVGDLIGTELRPNLLNTVWAFYLPSILAVGLKAGLFTFIFVQFYKGMPKELEEAASIDGAGPVKTFLSIVVPSSGVVFLTVTIFSVIWHWNDTYLCGLYFTNSEMLAVNLSKITDVIGAYGVHINSAGVAGPIMAACLLFILPVLIMYCILQKQFIKSIDRVGIVG